MSVIFCLEKSTLSTADWAAKVQEAVAATGCEELPLLGAELGENYLHPLVAGSLRGVSVDLSAPERAEVRVSAFASKADWHLATELLRRLVGCGELHTEDGLPVSIETLTDDYIQRSWHHDTLFFARGGLKDYAADAELQLPVRGFSLVVKAGLIKAAADTPEKLEQVQCTLAERVMTLARAAVPMLVTLHMKHLNREATVCLWGCFLGADTLVRGADFVALPVKGDGFVAFADFLHILGSRAEPAGDGYWFVPAVDAPQDSALLAALAAKGCGAESAPTDASETDGGAFAGVEWPPDAVAKFPAAVAVILGWQNHEYPKEELAPRLQQLGLTERQANGLVIAAGLLGALMKANLAGSNEELVQNLAAQGMPIGAAVPLVAEISLQVASRHGKTAAAQETDAGADDPATVLRKLRQAAESGNAEAQCMLGACYADGMGVAQNPGEAVKWFRKAAVQGHANAQYVLGICYTDGRGVAANSAEAVRWTCQAAENGHAAAQYKMGKCCFTADGVEENKTEGVAWFRKAAEQGHVEAQCMLGICCSNGDGVPADATEGLKWVRMAVEQGSADAQYMLGAMHANGDGVPEDAAEAVKCFRAAAAQGHAPAQSQFGLCHEEGYGVAQDGVEALAWILLAVAGGDEEAAAHRARLEQALGPEKAAQAQQRSRDLQKQIAAASGELGEQDGAPVTTDPPAPVAMFEWTPAMLAKMSAAVQLFLRVQRKEIADDAFVPRLVQLGLPKKHAEKFELWASSVALLIHRNPGAKNEDIVQGLAVQGLPVNAAVPLVAELRLQLAHQKQVGAAPAAPAADTGEELVPNAAGERLILILIGILVLHGILGGIVGLLAGNLKVAFFVRKSIGALVLWRFYRGDVWARWLTTIPLILLAVLGLLLSPAVLRLAPVLGGLMVILYLPLLYLCCRLMVSAKVTEFMAYQRGVRTRPRPAATPVTSAARPVTPTRPRTAKPTGGTGTAPPAGVPGARKGTRLKITRPGTKPPGTPRPK